jgi:integrase
VERVWISCIEADKACSTSRDYLHKWRLYLEPRCKDWWLRDVRTCDVEQLLKAIAREHKTEDEESLTTTTLQHIKAQISGIFTYAKRMGYYDGSNPVQGTSIPKSRPKQETHAYSLEEVLQIMSLFPEPACTLAATAAFTGMSLSEIQGLRWEDYAAKENEIRVTRSRVLGRDKETKTPYRQAPLPVIAPLARMLELHRIRSGSPSSGPVFRNGEGNPECLNNLRNRVILPSLTWCKECGKRQIEHNDKKAGHQFALNTSRILWHGYHAFRRGLATNLSRLGVPPKTVQAVLRHANLSTTMIHYVKSVEEDSVRALKMLETIIPESFGSGGQTGCTPELPSLYVNCTLKTPSSSTPERPN